MGNDASKDFSIDEKIETVSKNIWTLYKCTNTDGCPLSVFKYDLAAPHCKAQFVENAAKYLKVLRHPYVLKFHALSHSSKEAWLVTEHVTPLETLLDSLTADEILAGLYNLIEALSFLHDRGGLCHNNINVSSVFVADDGAWKLGAMECVCPFADASSAFLNQRHLIRSEKAIAPEEKVTTDQKQTFSPGHSRDAFAFGIFAEHVLEYLTDLGDRVSSFQRIVQDDLPNVVPKERPKLSFLLDNSLFRTDFIEICSFLRQITVKSWEEKSKFFRTVVEKLYRLPQELVASRLVKPLLSRFVVLDDDACEHLIPHLLMPITGAEGAVEYVEGQLNPILSEPLFRRFVIPEIYKIFHVRDAHIRSILLRHFHQYVLMFEHTALTEVIFPQILLSVRDASDDLVTLSLQAIALLVPILGGDIIVGAERPKIFYEGIPKFASVNGHVNVIPNGVFVIQDNHSATNTNRSNVALTSEPNSSTGRSTTVDAKQKREEARKRMEERRKKREEERRRTIASKVSAPGEEPSVLGNHPMSEEREQATTESPEDRPEALIEAASPAPLSPSYERTDSEIELEIEAELEAMKEAEKRTRSLGTADHDNTLTTTVNWDDVSRADQSTPKQAKGRLKLTLDKPQRGDNSGSAQAHDRTAEIRTEIRTETQSQSLQKRSDDQWEDDGWEDFDSAPKVSSSSPLGNKISSSATKANLSSVAQFSRMRSIEELPLGAGYDIMLIDVKTKPAEKGGEFDFFADMAPEIKPSGNSLMSILTGGKADKGQSKAVEKSSASSGGLFNQRVAVNTFDVRETENTNLTEEEEVGGWDAELDWTVDDKL